MIQALQTGSVAQIAGALQKVFEELCSEEEGRQLAAARELLQQHRAAGVLLSGSGSALFGLFEEEDTARTALHALQNHPSLEGAFLCRPWRRELTVLRGRYDIRFHPLDQEAAVCSRLSKWLFFDVGSTLVDEQLCYVLRLQEIASLANLPYELIWETAMQFYRQNQKGDARAAERFGVKMPAWHTEMERLYPDARPCLNKLHQRYSLGINRQSAAGDPRTAAPPRHSAIL